MRVLHVVAKAQRRGAEVFASDLVRALADRGVDQRVAIVRGNGNPDVDFAAPVTMLGADGKVTPGVRMHLGALLSLRNLVRDWAPDVVQAHGGEALKYSIPVSTRRARVVYRRIGAVGYWVAPGLRRVGHGELIRRAARIVAVAEAVRREMIEVFRLPPERIVTIPNAVDALRVTPRRGRREVRRSLGIPDGAPVVLSMGALSSEKDPLGHLAIAGAALRGVPGAVHLVAGDGPLRAQVEAEVERAGLEDRVILLGNRPDVADLLGASDALLLASLTEGMPAVVIEAGIAGVPVAAYAVAGVPEVVLDGETGLLAAPGDAGGLSGKLTGLLADAGLREGLGRRAAEVCRERFEIRPVAGSYLGVYEKLASRRRAGGQNGSRATEAEGP